MATKLQDDPQVQALLQKQGESLAKAHGAALKKQAKAIMAHVKDVSTQRVAQVKEAGQKEAAAHLKDLGATIVANIKVTHLTGETAA